MADDPVDSSHPVERRAFLKLGATGVVAGLTGCAPSTQQQPPAEATPPAAAATEPPPGPPPAPEVGDLVDPLGIQDESWMEPWLWRPEAWPGSNLELNVVAGQNPGAPPSPGNATAPLFSYNGTSPGPTVRVRADGELRVKIRNALGLDRNMVQVGPAPDAVDIPPATNAEVCGKIEEQTRLGLPNTRENCNAALFPEELGEVIRPEYVPSWALKGHVNGQHAAHVTNLHTHGLHVFPQTNPDGSHSDNVLLRVLPRADWEARQNSGDPDLASLAPNEHVGELDYRLTLSFERDGSPMPHPPGTHWYHPHAHGATHDQVASGMAGFLIVEGDVDDAINLAMTGVPNPDPEANTGRYDYRERLIFIQRVFVGSSDFDAGPRRNSRRFPSLLQTPPASPTFHMRPGAVERWRVLNGSVDGSGTKRFMVLEGQFVQRGGRLWQVSTQGEGDASTRKLTPVLPRDLESLKVPLFQLALDGITLVAVEDGVARHTIRDLSDRNAGTEDPLNPPPLAGESEADTSLRGFEACFRDGESLRRAFVRPNELYLTNANRADVFFKAPVDAAGKVYTVFAAEAHIQSDNQQRTLQIQAVTGRNNRRRPLFDTVVAYIGVRGNPVEGGDFDVMSLREVLPPVPPLLQPIPESELLVPAEEARRSGVPVGSARTRVIGYSGTGGAEFPSIQVPQDFVEAHPELENLTWGMHQGVPVLLPNLTRTMAIHPDFDLAANPDPDAPRKFMPDDPRRPRMLVNTAEEWALYGNSQMLWSQRDRERFPQPGSYGGHYRGYPISRAEGQRRYAEDDGFQISTRSNDHPFHMHINPMWVLRIDVPDENGDLHNVLPEPVWMDTIWIPRNGGRVVFRTRFDDFVGTWVNHCHILLHEDMGMMQIVECVDRPEEVNYRPRSAVASASGDGASVDAIYPKPSLEVMYRQNMSFVDPNEIGYQEYPGFELEVPTITDD